MSTTLGLDVGGANLKAAHSGGAALSQPFELWRNPGGLSDALRGLIAALPGFDVLAVTMTGELCDCFETKRAGVNAILDAVEAAAAGRSIRVWRTDGRLVGVAEARATPLKTAAANWLALATYAGRFVPKGAALLVDVGSTTTDIVPLVDGKPVPQGRTDPERLRSGELVYTGVRRTPLCAILGSSGAAEFFATTLDAYLLLGAIPENATDRGTADGRPATRAAAHARMARMLCADSETCSQAETQQLAQRVLLKQVYYLDWPFQQLKQRGISPQTAIPAGSGEFLARAALAEQKHFAISNIVSLSERLGPAVSAAACAHALAVLASEQLP